MSTLDEVIQFATMEIERIYYCLKRIEFDKNSFMKIADLDLYKSTLMQITMHGNLKSG